MKWADFLHADTNLGKLKATSLNCIQNGQNVLEYGTLKSGISGHIHKYQKHLSV